MSTNQIALMFKDDSEIGFYVRCCDRTDLHATILAGMYIGDTVETAEIQAEIDGIEKALLDSGSMQFEDGWIEMRTGVADVAAFFTEKLKEAKAEENHADQERYRELTGRKAAEANYEELRDALRLAIGNGPKAAALRFAIDQGASQ